MLFEYTNIEKQKSMPKNQSQITPTNSNTPTIIYKPSEILGIIASYFSQQDVNKHVIFLQGIHL